MSNQVKLRAIWREFPFLETIGRDLQACEFITIQRADEYVMSRAIPSQRRVVCRPYVDINSGDTVILYDSLGNFVGTVRPDREVLDFEQDQELRQRGETILDHIVLGGLTEQVHYVLWIRFGYDIVKNISQPTWRATIYKPNQELTLEEIAVQAVEAAEREVKAEVALVTVS